MPGEQAYNLTVHLLLEMYNLAGQQPSRRLIAPLGCCPFINTLICAPVCKK
jgi:hypothetical protein